MKKDLPFSIYLLLLMPFVLFVFAIPFANRVYPIICGMPFLLLWPIMSFFLSSACLLYAYYIEYDTINERSYSGIAKYGNHNI